MTDFNEQTPAPGVIPAPLNPALKARLLEAMLNAGKAEEEFRREEELLTLLRPAPMEPGLKDRVGLRMYLAATEVRRAHMAARPYWRRVSAAAILLMCCSLGVGISLQSDAAADTAQAVTSRSIIETSSGDSIRWDANAVPLQSVEVTYEDTFVMDAADDMKVMVSVPNRTEVTVPADLL
ncbi:MAG: hypothetical protein IJ498_05945 [Akkermansia sp.]|nr:hypothetical protein [Akkermansia sp.]